ncbi:response regulator [Sphingomonas sp. GB1N7]|uniref:response regulator n=1 Tax=Parasphingomonas caseinilytica TaxID=3096158 RepID=UPI002FC5F6A0
MEHKTAGSRLERRVVIVDDSRTIQAMLDNAFSKRSDFRVVGFSSDATMAVEMIRRLMPDIVTIDLTMPYIDGAALLAMIADLENVCKIIVSDIPVKNIVLSNKLRQAGAATCLGKSDLVENPDKFFAQVNAAAAAVSGAKRNSFATIDFKSQSGRQARALTAGSAPSFPIPADEQARLSLVRRKGLTNSTRERQFDLVTRHVARVTEFPVCLLTIMERDTQWIKSASGMDIDCTPRHEAFCNYTIAQGGTFIVANAARDDRFSGLPSVTDDPGIRCYAGHPVTTSDGVTVGALCVIDNRVRNVSKHVLDQLAGMAGIVAEMIDQRLPLAA